MDQYNIIDIQDIFWFFSKVEMDEKQATGEFPHFYFNYQIGMSPSYE